VRAACGREGWRRREAVWGEGLRVGNFYLFLLNVRVRNKIEERERGGCREIYIYIYIYNIYIYIYIYIFRGGCRENRCIYVLEIEIL
jgi:hypothetical protein